MELDFWEEYERTACRILLLYWFHLCDKPVRGEAMQEAVEPGLRDFLAASPALWCLTGQVTLTLSSQNKQHAHKTVLLFS